MKVLYLHRNSGQRYRRWRFWCWIAIRVAAMRCVRQCTAPAALTQQIMPRAAPGVLKQRVVACEQRPRAATPAHRKKILHNDAAARQQCSCSRARGKRRRIDDRQPATWRRSPPTPHSPLAHAAADDAAAAAVVRDAATACVRVCHPMGVASRSRATACSGSTHTAAHTHPHTPHAHRGTPDRCATTARTPPRPHQSFQSVARRGAL